MMGRFGARLLTVVALVAVMAFGGFAVGGAAAETAVTSDQYAKLKKQRTKQIKRCNARVKKANRALRKARKSHSAKRVRSAKKRLRKAKKSSKRCVKKAKRTYQNRLKKLAPKANAKATYKARGSVGDAYVTGAKQGEKLLLVNGKERTVQSGVADSFGSKVFYDVKPGAGYSVRVRVSKKRVSGTSRFRVLGLNENPSQDFYKNKPLRPGLNFVSMRDGIELAMTVRLPAGKTMKDGPFPTIIEHSGYGTAGPHDLLGAVLSPTPDPLAPDTSTAVGALIAPQMGFAAVSVQMRGTGCSGGAYDLFGLPTTYDGYDMVETVGNQSWVKGKVGMAGISYSGISQLFAGGTKPPHLAAISPMSVTTDLYSGTGYPGGMFNKGFALSWITDRVNDAKPAPGGGQAWAKYLIEKGDPKVTDARLRASQQESCLKNQNLRLQTRDVFKLVEDNPFRTPSIFENRAPGKWLAKVDVPVFLTGSFQDEQTGGQFPDALGSLKNNPNVWMMLQNGVHVDSLGPSVITDWGDFMNLFVADRLPSMPGLLTGLSSALYKELADAPALPVKESRYCKVSVDDPSCTYTSVEKAKADFKANTPRLRLLMDNGAATVQGPNPEPDDPPVGTPLPGGIGASWQIGLPDWPVPSTKATEYYLGTGGALTTSKPGGGTEVSYTADPAARPKQTLPGSGDADAWKAQPNYNWTPIAANKGLGFTSGAMTENTLIAGPSSLDLQVKSSALDTDIQVAITEVRPDGHETYVQSGWLRASHRHLDPARSTALMPVPTHLEKDAANLPAGKFTEVRVPIFPVAHMFRIGSKIRVTITAAGGDRPRWDFETIDNGKALNTIQLGGATPSKLVLPIIPKANWNKGGSLTVPALPSPTALRGEPDRTYQTATNGG